MQTISNIVFQIICLDPIAYNYLSKGLLNSAQYARDIQPKVEEIAYKKVTVSSIITSLSRIKTTLERQEPTKCRLVDIQLKSPIFDMVFDLDQEALNGLKDLYPKSHFSDFFNVVIGVTEVNIFCSLNLVEKIKSQFQVAPVFERSDLVGITVKFAQNYIDEPAITYQLLRSLAMKKINIIATLTSLRETTIFVSQKNSQRVIDIFTTDFME
jgi:hypothetical protein